MSEEASRFLESVDLDIRQQGEPSKTSSQTDGIEVDVRLPSESSVNIELRDLRGGDLADQIDRILSKDVSRTEGGLQTQVRNYDAFLFFFDPTNSNATGSREVPSASRAVESRREHYEREQKRAQLFAEYVHQRRQNRHLPIVFVATRRDLLEEHPDIRAECVAWLQQTCEQLRQDYASRLGRHFPPSLVESSSMTIEVGSMPEGNMEKVVDKLVQLVDDVREFRRRDFWRVVRSVMYGLLLMVLVGAVTCGIYWLVGGKHVPAPDSAADPMTGPNAEPLSAAEIGRRLKTVEAWLAALPTDPPSLDVSRAKQLNVHLAWMLNVRETGEIRQADPDEKLGLADHVDRLLNRACSAVREASLSAPPTQESTDWLTACLAELPLVRQSPEDLVQSYVQYWKLYRAQVIEQLGTTLRNQHDAGSEPKQILNRITDQLDRFVQDVAVGKVHRLEAQPPNAADPETALRNELVVASQYCKNLSDHQGCKVKLAVTGAAYQSTYGITPATRRLVFHSSRQTSPYEVRLQPKAIVETSGIARCSFDITPDTPADVDLALGAPGTLTLGILLKDTRIWEDICTVDLRSLPSEGTSLGILGLPLVMKSEASVLQHVLPLPEGYEIRVELSGWHPPPSLLWDAVDIAERR